MYTLLVQILKTALHVHEIQFLHKTSCNCYILFCYVFPQLICYKLFQNIFTSGLKILINNSYKVFCFITIVHQINNINKAFRFFSFCESLKIKLSCNFFFQSFTHIYIIIQFYEISNVVQSFFLIAPIFTQSHIKKRLSMKKDEPEKKVFPEQM